MSLALAWLLTDAMRYVLVALDVADINMIDKTPVWIISAYKAPQDTCKKLLTIQCKLS